MSHQQQVEVEYEIHYVDIEVKDGFTVEEAIEDKTFKRIIDNADIHGTPLHWTSPVVKRARIEPADPDDGATDKDESEGPEEFDLAPPNHLFEAVNCLLEFDLNWMIINYLIICLDWLHDCIKKISVCLGLA